MTLSFDANLRILCGYNQPKWHWVQYSESTTYCVLQLNKPGLPWVKCQSRSGEWTAGGGWNFAQTGVASSGVLIRQDLHDDSQSCTGENVSNQVYLVHYDRLLCGAKPKISPKIALVFAFPAPKQIGCKVSDNLLFTDPGFHINFILVSKLFLWQAQRIFGPALQTLKRLNKVIFYRFAQQVWLEFALFPQNYHKNVHSACYLVHKQGLR